MIWYMFPVQCEEIRINHLTLLLVVTMPYACWFLWRADYIEDFKWRLHFQFGVALWRVVLREVYFEGSNRVWRALKTSILNTASFCMWILDICYSNGNATRVCPFNHVVVDRLVWSPFREESQGHKKFFPISMLTIFFHHIMQWYQRSAD